MVLINEKKYACETCIKGHRSSGCKHTDRPLYEIKKKGRPVTQCEHCRELRKTKQVHVKCICPKGEGSNIAPQCSLKGANKMLQLPAFPNGLPEALEASVAMQFLSEGISSDSEYGSCSCISTGSDCHCSRPLSRKPSNSRRAKDDKPAKSVETFSTSEPQPLTYATSRRADFHHVLPQASSTYSRHNSHPHHDLHHNHLHQHHYDYSPYGRAYDHARPNHPERRHPQMVQHEFSSEQTSRRYPYSQSRFSQSSSSIAPSMHEGYGFDTAEIEAWNTFQASVSSNVSNSVSGCGEGCTCRSCSNDRPNARLSPLSSSAQTDTCRPCVDSDVYRHSQPELPPNTALSIYNNDDTSGVIDAWIKQTQDPLHSFESHSQSDVESFSDSSSISYPYYETHQLVGGSCGGGNPYPGRVHAFDEFQIGFNDSKAVDLNADVGLYIFSSEYASGLPYDSVSSSTLDSMLGMDSLAAELADVIHRSRSASTSESETSSESEVSEQSGEIPLHYRYGGTGAGIASSGRTYLPYGANSSTSSLPETLGYF